MSSAKMAAILSRRDESLGIKSLSQPMMTEIYDAVWHHQATMN